MLWFSATAGRVFAQRAEPMGNHVVAGLTFLNGYGVQLGLVNARDFFTREVLLHTDLRSVVDPQVASSQVVFLLGGALRVFGFERSIGNVPYRGYDIDTGLRIGPAYSFSTRETDASRNRRFHLFVEPFLRVSARTSLLDVVYLETGTTRPHVRLGIWIGF